MACCNFEYLKSLSGIFRLLTVLTGIPLITLAWIAYFSSSWTNVWPEILAILAVEKSAVIVDLEKGNSIEQDDGEESTTIVASSSKLPGDFDSEEFDIISDKEEEYLDEIILETLLYEKFFIGIVSVVFLMSTAYLILRILSMSRHHEDSPYEIMFDFIFHVLCALGLLTGSGLVLMSAAKIQSFVEQVENRDGFAPPEIVEIIHENKDNVQDKVDKIAAAVVGMVNGIFYALCVVTLRMTNPVKCKTSQNKNGRIRSRNKKGLAPYHHNHTDNDMPIFSVMPYEYQQQLREQQQAQQQQNREINQNDPYFLPYVLPRRSVSVPQSYE